MTNTTIAIDILIYDRFRQSLVTIHHTENKVNLETDLKHIEHIITIISQLFARSFFSGADNEADPSLPISIWKQWCRVRIIIIQNTALKMDDIIKLCKHFYLWYLSYCSSNTHLCFFSMQNMLWYVEVIPRPLGRHGFI